MEVTVVKSTLSTKGGYVNTIEGVKKSKALGVTKTSKMRFLMKTDEAAEVNSVHVLDLSQYNQVVRESKVVNQETGEEITITSTWLHDKAEA
jgi:hypothetical protein